MTPAQEQRFHDIGSKLSYPEYADEIPLEQLEDFGWAMRELNSAWAALDKMTQEQDALRAEIAILKALASRR